MRLSFRTRVLVQVEDHPGHTAAEIADALGLRRDQIAPCLRELTFKGQLVKAAGRYTPRVVPS